MWQIYDKFIFWSRSQRRKNSPTYDADFTQEYLSWFSLGINEALNKFFTSKLIFSQSFHYAGFHDNKGQFHERLAPLYEPSAIDIVRNQGAGTELQNRKLPDLPDSKFNPVHSTARRNPLSVRSAPNLHRLENIILVNESPIPKTDDSSGESNFNEKSPLIRKSQR